MRRPLCAAGVVYLAVLFLIQCLIPPHPAGIRIEPDTGPAEDIGEPYFEAETLDKCGDKRSVTVTGTVISREYKIYSGVRTLLIYVKTDSICNSLKQSDNLLFSDKNKAQEKKSKERSDLMQAEHYVLACTMKDPVPPPEGSRVSLYGTLSLYNAATDPGEFDMQRYEQTVGVDGKLDRAVIIRRGTEYDRLRERLAVFRDYAAAMLINLFGEHDGGILSAMVLGDKSGLDADTRSMYQRNGIIHILAISGLHISLIGMGLYKLLKRARVPSVPAAVISVGMMYMYGIMCGMAASAERAIVMFALGMLAKMIGRTYDLLTALCIAALMIATKQPMYLQYSGFLFSFGAVLAIGMFLPAAKDVYVCGRYKIPRVPGKKQTKGESFGLRMIKTAECSVRMSGENKAEHLRSALISGAVISVITLPVHLYFYYQFPLFSLLLNLAVIPLMTFVMAGTLLSLSFSFIFYPLGKLAVPMVHAILCLYEAGCRIGDRLPVNQVVTGQPHWQQIFLFYLMIGIVFGMHKYIPRHIFTMFVLTAVSVLVIHADSGLKMTFIDVGQGDGIYVTDNRGLDIMVDGGSSTKKNIGQYVLEPFIKSQGAGSLDAVFITHLDSDHYNGILELIELSDEGGVGIDKIILNSAVYDAGGAKFDELTALAGEHGIPVVKIHSGMGFTKGQLSVSCLYPYSDMKADEEDTNETSTVLYLRYGKFTALLTGDLQGNGEDELDRIIDDRRFIGHRLTVLKVAHHGSKNSTFEGFLSETRPEVSVLSAGRGNRYGHPHRELLRRLDAAGTQRICTADRGAVTVCVSPGGCVKVSGFIKQGAAREAVDSR